MVKRSLSFALVVVVIGGVVAALSDRAFAESASTPFAIASGDDKLTVAVDGMPVAVYCFGDEQVPRPYFAHVRAPSGIQVTRHMPPVEGQDPLDHPTFHPGIWLAFGDINGSDYWRLQANVRHAGFVGTPQTNVNSATFAVRNEYLAQDNPEKVICRELARYTFLASPGGYWLLWDSTFSGDQEFAFGDQEEMGLGVRLATPLSVKAMDAKLPAGNGTILNAEGQKNGEGVWGKSSAWCDYTGTIAGQDVGVTIFCHPENFRPCWFHARDYGFFAANPFGRQAMSEGKEEKSSVVVKPGEKLRLRFGIWIHSAPAGTETNLAVAYDEYLALSAK